MAQLGFATAEAPERQNNFDVIRGTFPAQITESDVIATKTGGKGAKFTFEIIDGPHRGRKVWGFINVENANPTAQEIGQAELRELCEAVGLDRIDDTTQLEFKPLMLRCGPDKQDPERTVPKGYKPYDANWAAKAPAQARAQPARSAAPPAQRQAAPPPQQAAGGQARPWAR